MDKKYIIMCRYEALTVTGKEWTNWFVYDSTKYSENEGNEVISENKKAFEYIDNKTKLKHEYVLKPYDEYKKEYDDMVKQNKKMIKENEKYFKSDEYKALQKKKRQAAKERKERQKKYLEEHGLI